jgi:hypothetical protein
MMAFILTPTIRFANNATIDALNVLPLISIIQLAMYVEEIEKMMLNVIVMMDFMTK